MGEPIELYCDEEQHFLQELKIFGRIGDSTKQQKPMRLLETNAND